MNAVLDTPILEFQESKLTGKSVVIGANGMVGYALMSYLSDAVGTFRNWKNNLLPDRNYEFLDITDKEQVNSFFEKYRPKTVFLAAANAAVDDCEKNPEADKTNISGVTHVLSNCEVYDAQLVFFSSSYVFEGTSQVAYKTKDETFPVNRYGRQKEQIERLIKSREGLQWLIIRTVGVFGHEGTPKNFVAQIQKAVEKKRKVCVPSDQTMNPVWSMDLARTVIHLSNRYSCETFHVAGDKCISKYDFAVNVAYKLGCKKPHELIAGMKSEEMNQLANRPKNGCLDCGQLQARAIRVPSLEKGLWKFVRQEYGIVEQRNNTKSS